MQAPPPPPMAAGLAAVADDDLDEMINQIELDQSRGAGLAWTDSQDGVVVLPPSDEAVDGGASPPRAPPTVLPDARPDPRIHTHTVPFGHEQEQKPRSVLELQKLAKPGISGAPRKSLNPLAAVVAGRLEEKARQDQQSAAALLARRAADGSPPPLAQDPRVQTQAIQPTVVAGQDYRVQTHAFPQGLLDKQGISLQHGGRSSLDQNESLMRNFQQQVGLLQRHSSAGGNPEDWDGSSVSDSLTGSESCGGSSSFSSSHATSSQAISVVSEDGGTKRGADLIEGCATDGDATKRRNKEAAREYRRRKKEYMLELQANVQKLEREKAEMAARLAAMEGENTMLRQLVGVGQRSAAPSVAPPDAGVLPPPRLGRVPEHGAPTITERYQGLSVADAIPAHPELCTGLGPPG